MKFSRSESLRRRFGKALIRSGESDPMGMWGLGGAETNLAAVWRADTRMVMGVLTLTVALVGRGASAPWPVGRDLQRQAGVATGPRDVRVQLI